MHKTLMPAVLVMLIALLATVALAASPPTILVGTGTITSVEKVAPSQAAVPVALKSEAGTVAYQGYTEPTKKMAADTDVGTEISRTAVQAAPDTPTLVMATTGMKTTWTTFTKATDTAPSRISVAMPMPVGLTTSTVATAVVHLS